MTLISRTHRSSRPAARTLALALEPRLLFDGAGAVAAVDHADSGADHGNTAELHRPETQNSRAPGEEARETRPTEHLEKPATGNTLLLIDARGICQDSCPLFQAAAA